MSRAGRTTRDRAREAPAARDSRRDAGRTRRRRPGAPERDARRTAPEGRRTSGATRVRQRATAPVTSLRSRRRDGSSSLRRRLLLASGALAVVAALAVLLWAGPVLAVRTVRVDGAQTLPADQVRRAAGVERGTPLLQVDVAAAEARVARLPQVAAVEVDRGWPASVVITLQERAPVAVVAQGGQRSLVDATGVLFDTITGPAPEGVVSLDVAAPGPQDPATVAALAAITALPPEVRPRITGAAAGTARDVRFELADGTAVRWGGGEDSAAKARVLTALLAQLDAGTLEPAGTLDVSEPDAVVLR